MTAVPKSDEQFQASIAQIYDVADRDYSSLPKDSGRFLHSLIRLIRPKCCVELGSFRGVSSLWMAKAISDNGEGRLYCFDIFEHSQREEVIARLKSAGVADVVEVYQAPSTTKAVQIMRDLRQAIDFIFIDADHRDLVPSAELLSYWSLLRLGGLMVFHDINPDQCAWDGPRFTLDMMRRNGIGLQNACILELPTVEGYGLGVIQKCESARPPILPSLAYLAYQWRTRFRFWLKY